MLNFLLLLFFICLLAFAGFHIFFAVMAGSIAIAGGAWAFLIAAICTISMGILALFLFAGIWIFFFVFIVGIAAVIAIILFPIFLPILLPLIILMILLSLFRKKDHD